MDRQGYRSKMLSAVAPSLQIVVVYNNFDVEKPIHLNWSCNGSLKRYDLHDSCYDYPNCYQQNQRVHLVEKVDGMAFFSFFLRLSN